MHDENSCFNIKNDKSRSRTICLAAEMAKPVIKKVWFKLIN